MKADARKAAGLVRSRRQQPSDQPHVGSAVRTAKTSSTSWDAFADVDAFVDEVLAELAAIAADGTRLTRPEPKAAQAGVGLRKAIIAIWCLCVCGVQWRAVGQLWIRFVMS